MEFDKAGYFAALRTPQLFLFEAKVEKAAVWAPELPSGTIPGLAARVKLFDLPCVQLGCPSKCTEDDEDCFQVCEEEAPVTEDLPPASVKSSQFSQSRSSPGDDKSESKSLSPQRSRRSGSAPPRPGDCAHPDCVGVPIVDVCCPEPLPRMVCDSCGRESVPPRMQLQPAQPWGGRTCAWGSMGCRTDCHVDFASEDARRVYATTDWEGSPSNDDICSEEEEEEKEDPCDFGVEINACKSTLFIGRPIKLLHQLQRQPLVVMVYCLDKYGRLEVRGTHRLPLPDRFFEAIEMSIRSPLCLPSVAELKACLALFEPNDPSKVVGTVGAMFRLSAYGPAVWSSLKSPGGNENRVGCCQTEGVCPGYCPEDPTPEGFVADDCSRRLQPRDVLDKPAIITRAEHIMGDDCINPCDPKPPRHCPQKIPKSYELVVDMDYTYEPEDSEFSEAEALPLPKVMPIALPETVSLVAAEETEGTVAAIMSNARKYLTEINCDPRTESEMEMADVLSSPVAVPMGMTEWSRVHAASCPQFPQKCTHYALLYPGQGVAKDPNAFYTLNPETC